MISAIKTILWENWTNRKRMLRLANYEAKSKNSGTVLGFLWNFLNPALQIFVYWFVFSIGLNTNPPKAGYPYVIWMIVGIIPWFYISDGLQQGAMSLYGYSSVLKRVYLPLSIVPVKTVFSGFLTHIYSMIVVFAILLIARLPISNMIWQLPYYMFALIVFLIAWSLFASAITVLFKDFQKILSAVVRLLFYLSPVVWDQSVLSEKLQTIFSFNPIGYVLNGYRNSILYGVSISENWQGAIIFWCIVLVLLVVGASVHMKFRRKFMDLL